MSLEPSIKNALAPYMKAWALPTSQQRMLKRIETDLAQIKAFHDAFIPHLEPVLEHLKDRQVAELEGEDLDLAHAVFALCEIDNPVNKNWKGSRLSTGISEQNIAHKVSFYR